MSLVRKIALNTAIQFAGKATGTVLALITISLMMRYLGKSGFGEYATIVGYLSVFGIIADLGLYLVVTREISKKGVDEEKIVSNAFTIKLLAGVFILALAPAAALLFPYTTAVKLGIIICAFSQLFLLLNQTIVGVFQKYLRMDKVVIGEFLGRICWLAGAFFVIKSNLGLLALMAVIVLSNFLNFSTVFAFSRKYVKICLRFDWDVWKRIMKIATPLAFSIVFTLIHYKIGIVLLSVLKPPSEVGVYGAPYKVLEGLIAFAAIFAGLLLPILSKHAYVNPNKFAQTYQKGFDALAIFVIPLIFGTFYFAKPIMVLFGGQEFEISAQVLKILIFAVGVIFFTHLFGNTVVAINQQKKMMWVYLIAAVLAISLNLALIPPFSYFGVAVTSVFTETLVGLATAYIVYQTTKIAPKFKIFFKSIVASLIMMSVIFFLPDWYFMIKIALACIVYFVILYLIRGFTKEVILEIIRIKQ